MHKRKLLPVLTAILLITQYASPLLSLVPVSAQTTSNHTNQVCQKGVNLLQNAGFESPVVSNPALWDIFPDGAPSLNWKVEWTGGSTSFEGQNRPDVANLELHRGVFDWAPSGGDQYAELDADWFGPGDPLNNEPASVKISQNITTVAGFEYKIKYDFSPRPGTPEGDNQLIVGWGGSDVDTKSAAGEDNTVWATYEKTVKATGNTTNVSFRDNGTPNSLGTFLYNVSVECVGSTNPPAPKLSEVKVCKIDNDHKPLSGWNVQLLGDFVETVQVSPDDTLGNITPHFSNSLPLGNYVLMAKGSYVYRSGGFLSDPGYSERDPVADAGQPYFTGPYLPWVNTMQFSAPYVGALGIIVNDTPQNWGYYSPGHVYARGYTGYSGQFKFTSIDDVVTDNSGSMSVDIYKGYAGTTGSDGCVKFKDVPYGKYVTEEILMQNWENKKGKGLEVRVNDKKEKFNIENKKLPVGSGRISGEKYEDKNGNGARNNGEDRLDGWKINLYNSQWGLIQSMQTGDDTTPAGNVSKGEYKFVGLHNGAYHVCEEQQDGWMQTQPVGQTYLSPDIVPPVDSEKCYHLEIKGSKKSWTGLRFGNFKLGEVNGFKWDDDNGNGVVNSGEPKMSGWTIQLWDDEQDAMDNTGTPLDSTTTGSDGFYKFVNLNPGTYFLTEVNQLVPNGEWIQTFPDEPNYHTFTISESGQVVNNMKFGNNVTGDILAEKTVASDEFEPGDIVTFNLKVTNKGTEDIKQGITVWDVIPEGMEYAGSNPIGNLSIDGKKVSWNINELAVNEVWTATINLKILEDSELESYTNHFEAWRACELLEEPEAALESAEDVFEYCEKDPTPEDNVAEAIVPEGSVKGLVDTKDEETTGSIKGLAIDPSRILGALSSTGRNVIVPLVLGSGLLLGLIVLNASRLKRIKQNR